MTERYDILIGGGSFAGLALARALGVSLGEGCRIGVVERRQLPPAAPSSVPDALGPGRTGDGGAVALSASSVRMLTALGVWADLAPNAQAVSAIEITDTSLAATVRLPVLSYPNQLDDDEAASVIVETADLSSALLRAVRATSGVTLLDGRTIAAFQADDAGVHVTLADGALAGGDRRTGTAALLVAADGRESRLRGQAGIKTAGWAHDQVGILTTVAHELPHGGRATQHFLPAGPFAILPLSGATPTFSDGGRSCVTWTENARRAAEIIALDDAGFLAELEARFGTRLGALALDGRRSSYPLATQLARGYIARRFALIGDAAHAVHPIAGQGLNLALRDVAALTECIADAARLGLDIGAGEPLERYERWRRFDSTVAAAGMDGLNRVFSNDWVLARTLRDAGAGLIDRAPGLKRALVRQAAGVTGDVPKLLRGVSA